MRGHGLITIDFLELASQLWRKIDLIFQLQNHVDYRQYRKGPCRFKRGLFFQLIEIK